MNLEISSQFHQKTLSFPAVAGRNLFSFLYLAEIPCRGYGCQPWATPWVIVRTPIGRLVKAKESLPQPTPNRVQSSLLELLRCEGGKEFLKLHELAQIDLRRIV